MKTKLLIVLCFYLLFMTNPSHIYADNNTQIKPIGKINAKGAILVEEQSMRVLWERNGMTPLPMASTTKIMTAIVALENGDLKDVVTTSKRAALAPRVKLDLKVGEKQILEDLLYALMLESSNDAAVAIAEHIGGSVEDFCNIMTKKAREIGATTATFKTPNGLDASGHMSSPLDLAIITKYAYSNSKFLEIINTNSKNIPSVALEGSKPHSLSNKNRFLVSYGGANGVKTGFTGMAGHCFVGGAKKDGMQLFAVALASGWGAGGRNQKYIDVTRLLDYGFANYEKVQVKNINDEAGESLVIRGEEDKVGLVYGEGLSLPLTKEEKDQISVSLAIPGNINAPIVKNQVVGTAHIYINKKQVATLPIVTVSDVEQKTLKKYFKKAIIMWTDLLKN